MLPVQVVYHPRYDLNLGPHFFLHKNSRWFIRALGEGLADEGDFVEPQSALMRMCCVCTRGVVRKLQTDTLTLSERMNLEISRQRVNGAGLLAGGGGLYLLAGPQGSEDGLRKPQRRFPSRVSRARRRVLHAP